MNKHRTEVITVEEHLELSEADIEEAKELTREFKKLSLAVSSLNVRIRIEILRERIKNQLASLEEL